MADEPAKIEIEVLGKNGKPIAYFKGLAAQHNPPEYTVTKGAQIAEIAIPGLDSPILQFVRGTTEQVTLRLFFDTTEKDRDVREETEKFYRLVKMDSDLHAPPLCRLKWGEAFGARKLGGFSGVVSNISQKFNLFKSNGVPLRAEVDVTFREYKNTEMQIRELNLRSSDHTKVRKIMRGETLSSIAADTYGDSNRWREIARANNISNPRDLVPGLTIKIPPLD